MDRSQKEAFLKDFTDQVATAQAMAVMSFNKLSVEQMTSFRLGLRKQGVRVKVVKNTLARRVLNETPLKGLSDNFTGPTLVAYSDGDAVVAAKAICEWLGKEGFDLNVKGGSALGQVMSPAQITALSRLPGKNELFVGFLWALKSAPTQFLYALQDTPRKLGYALGALKDQKEKASA
ncbi:50S ribosomal protein L10 [bacterium]|nr:50S ribosomal protein L10 [bacterium]